MSKISRRGFCWTVGAAGIVSAGTGTTHAQEAKTSASKGQSPRLFELGTVTYNLGRNWDLDRLIQVCEETDFRAVELRTTHKHGVEPEISSSARTSVRKRFEQASVQLICLGTACEYHAPDPETVRKNIELSKQFVDLAQDVGAKGIKVRPNGIPSEIPVEQTLKQIGDSLGELGEYAEDRNVGIWVEVHGRDSSHPPYMKKMMDYANHPSVGLTWNSNQNDLKDGSIAEYFKLLSPHIRNVHINELFSGYPYRDLFARLRGIGYDGYTMAEIPEAQGDPIRFMKYYRKLWDSLSAPSDCS